jgi:hypothetical protein
MSPTHFTYDELTPLEQCIADFMARQEQRREQKKDASEKPRPVQH